MGRFPTKTPGSLKAISILSRRSASRLKDLIGYSIQNYYARIRFTETFKKGIQTAAFLEAKQSNVSSIVIVPESLVGPTSLSTGYPGIVTDFRFPG